MGIAEEGKHFLWYVVGLLICYLSVSSADSNRYLHVPALGRSVELGYLYNARKDEFRDSSVFRNSQYKDQVTEIQTPRSTMESTTSSTFDDISELLGIDTDTAASILSGWLTKKHIGGAAGILKRTLENPLEQAGTLILKHQTVEQSLPLWYDQLRELYNTDILAHKEATHIVSGITWGGSLSIKFRDDATPPREQKDFHASLNAIFLKLEGSLQTSNHKENETFDFTTFVTSDITLHKLEISSTRDVLALTNEFENRLQNLNGGKGVPIMYKLTPLRLIQKHIGVKHAPNITAHDITTTSFKRFVRIFEDLWNSQKLLNELYAVSSKPNCILPENLEKIKELQSSFAEYKETLTGKFKQVLFDVRSGIQQMSALSDLAQEYKAGNFNSKMVKIKLSELNDAFKKFEFCKTVENSDNNVEYFGSRQDLVSIIYQNSDKNVYLFFTKTEFAKNDPIKYTENLNYFLKTLQMPSNKLLIVDCDFSHDSCDKISEPTIHEYKNNELTSTDFKQTVYDEQMNLQEQINELKNNLNALKSITVNIEQTYEAKNLCSPNKCLNGGSCVDAENNFECICSSGYEGRKCEKQTDLCESSPCLNNGVCHSAFNSYGCACAAGFQGVTCADDINICASNKTVCENGGKCIEEADGFSCACPFSWVGRTCHQKLDPCALNKCENGATCNPSADLLSSTCTCMSGYTGANCDHDVDECAMNNSLCRNGGSCQNTNGSYTCSCAEIYEGNNCEIVTSDCLRNNDCINGATCEDTIENGNQSSHRCLCAAGFAGPTCSCNLGSQNVASLKVVTITECGGLVKIPDLPSQTSFLLDYKSNVADTKQERCLWTLDTTKGDRSYALQIRVTLLCDGFDNSSDALSVMGWKWNGSEWNLTQNLLSKQTPKYEPGTKDYKLFLNYMSTNARHSGFILQVDVISVESSFSGSNFVSKITASSQSQSFGPYKANEFFSMTVISPQPNFTLTVDRLDSKKTGPCQGHDVLHIYKISSVRSSDTIAELCGSSTTPISYTSAYPIVVLHYTEKSTTGRGFSLSWK